MPTGKNLDLDLTSFDNSVIKNPGHFSNDETLSVSLLFLTEINSDLYLPS